MTESKTDVLLLMLMGVVILLMAAIIGLFLRMNQLQRTVLRTLASSPAVASAEKGLGIGTEAPDFALPDTNGATVSLGDFAGQKVLLAFSSTHCSACTKMYSHLRAFSEDREDVLVVMISQGSAEENRQLVEEQGFAFPVLRASGWDDPVMVEYAVPGTPFFCVVDEEGTIANADFANTLEQLKALVGSGGE
jgi:methylamine dehydrogenase accessory protein MauD